MNVTTDPPALLPSKQLPVLPCLATLLFTRSSEMERNTVIRRLSYSFTLKILLFFIDQQKYFQDVIVVVIIYVSFSFVQ
jgi:hypothetical protein